MIGVRIFFGACLGVCVGCTETSRPLRVEFAGCDEILTGPRCVVNKATALRLWVDGAERADKVRVSVDGRAVSMMRTASVQGGTFIAVEVAPSVRTLTVRSESAGKTSIWSLPFHPSAMSEALQDAVNRYRSEPTDAQLHALEGMGEAASPGDRARMESAIARAALAHGRPTEAAKRLERAIKLHDARGCVSCAVNDGLVLAYTFTSALRDYGGAERALQHATRPATAYPESEAHRPYYRAVLEIERGNLPDAVRQLESASRVAERLGADRLALDIKQVWARELRTLGRNEEARRIFEDLIEIWGATEEECTRAYLFINAVWGELLLGETTGLTVPMEWAHSGVEATAGSCKRLRGSALLNLALAELEEGDVLAARGHLDDAAPLLVNDDRRAGWQLEATARIFAVEGDFPGAVSRFGQLLELGEKQHDAARQWRAQVGLARGYVALGDREAAVSAFEASELLLEERAKRIGFEQGHASFIGIRSSTSWDYARLLLAMGQRDTAYRVVRRARRRALLRIARLEAMGRLSPRERKHWDRARSLYREHEREIATALREEWKLTADRAAQNRAEVVRARREQLRIVSDAYSDLAEPRRTGTDWEESPRATPGELRLTVYPSRSAWLVFAHDDIGLESQVVTAPTAAGDWEHLGHALLEPFARQIDRASTIALVASGVAMELDLHALPWRGLPLYRQKRVRYSLDLPPRVREHGAGKTLIVGDPTGDLAAARHEAKTVRRLLGATASTVVLLGQGATRDAVLESLTQARSFHFAGHGTVDLVNHWRSRLHLADGGGLRIGDVMALERVPEFVALIGCETGGDRSFGTVSGFNFPAAWLSRGSRFVIATTRRLEDDVGRRFSAAFYRARGEDEPQPVSEAFFRATEVLVESGVDASVFRLFTRY